MKRRILILLIGLMASFSALSQSRYIDGEGRFYAHEDDSLSFVKKQLLFNAYSDIITKELKELKLDPELFWSKFDMKFEDYFSGVQENLKNTYKIVEGEEVSKRQQAAYEKALRSKKLTLRSRYGKLSRVISSYSVRKMTRSTQAPQSRYMNVQAKVDRKLLTKIYFDFTRVSNFQAYRNLFVTVEFSLGDMSWLDLGVDVEKDFTQVIKEHWRVWLSDQLKGVVENVIIADEAMNSKLNDYMKIPLEATIAFNKDDSKIQENTSMALLNLDDMLQKSLWLKVRVDIKKKGDIELVQKREFKFDGDFVLQDLSSKKIVSFFDFIAEDASFSYENGHELSSNTASLVYRLPMNEFKNFKTKLLKELGPGKRITLEIMGSRSIAEVNEFSSLLQSRGVVLNIGTKVLSVTPKVTTLEITYRGDNEALVTLLRGMNGVEVRESRLLSLNNTDNPFYFNLISAPVQDKDKRAKN